MCNIFRADKRTWNNTGAQRIRAGRVSQLLARAFGAISRPLRRVCPETPPLFSGKALHLNWAVLKRRANGLGAGRLWRQSACSGKSACKIQNKHEESRSACFSHILPRVALLCSPYKAAPTSSSAHRASCDVCDRVNLATPPNLAEPSNVYPQLSHGGFGLPTTSGSPSSSSYLRSWSMRRLRTGAILVFSARSPVNSSQGFLFISKS
jgi:hypothetical protein